jgi:hypothetical protein
MTFLREPVYRVISHYYRHVLTQSGETKKRYGADVDSLERALAEPQLFFLSNLQTRFVCSDPSPRGPLPESALDDAKANLNRFAFFGLQERFTESLALFQLSLGLDLQPATDRHVSTTRPSVEEMGEDERRLIEEHNRLDAELYRYAQELFEERLASAGEGFADRVEGLREETRAFNEEDQAALQATVAWLEGRLPEGASKLSDEVKQAAEQAGITTSQLKRAHRTLKRQRPAGVQSRS